MPVTISRVKLSGSTDFQMLTVTATQGATLNTIHTCVTGTNTIDQVTIYCQNDYSQSVELILEWGTSQSGQHMAAQIPPRDGPQLVCAGLPFQCSASVKTISAFVEGLGGSASPAISGSSLISLIGWVDRMVQT